MSQQEILSQEVMPTFWRLTKLYWSQFWRTMLFFFPFFLIFFVIGASGEIQDLESFYSLEKFPYQSPLVIRIEFFIGFYFIQCLLFHLIIGKKYSDFKLCLLPNLALDTPKYWPTLLYISWAYHWRAMILSEIFFYLESWFPQVKDVPAYPFFYSSIYVIIMILLQRYVVNHNYGKSRLSLIARKDS